MCSSYVPHLCIQNGVPYCCSDYSYYSYSCGNYYNSCNRIDQIYMDCSGLLVGQWVMSGLSCVVLVILMILAFNHRKANQAMFLHGYRGPIPQNNGISPIIYSDQNSQNHNNQIRTGAINESIQTH